MPSSPLAGTRERILAATEELLGEVGYHGMRLRQVAQRVGIQKSSLFHHFASKEALYRATVEDGVRDGDELARAIFAMPRPPADRVRALVEAYVDEVGRNADRTRILARHALGDAPRGVAAPEVHPLLAALIDVVREGRRSGDFAPIDEIALVISVIGIAAFLFAAAPLLSREVPSEEDSPYSVARVKRHVLAMVERTLALHASDGREASSGRNGSAGLPAGASGA